MTRLVIELTDGQEKELADRAKLSGKTVEQLVLEAIGTTSQLARYHETGWKIVAELHYPEGTTRQVLEVNW